MAPPETLSDAAYAVADAYRSHAWPEWEGDDRKAWAFLVGELERRCPGFTREEYGRALGQGFFESR